MSERTPFRPADLQPSDVFETFSTVLTQQGRYRGDAHYLFAPVTLLDKEEPRLGTLRLEDYNSWASTEYGLEIATANEAAQMRLLGLGRAILGLQFSGESRRSVGLSYALCIPETVRKDQIIGGIFYDVVDDDIFIPADLGMPADPAVPAIVKYSYTPPHSEATQYEYVTEPRQEPQLFAAYQALVALSQSS